MQPREIWKTADQGASLNKIYEFQSPEYAISIHCFGDTVFIAGSTSFLKSVDKGQTFQRYLLPNDGFTPRKYLFINSMLIYQIGQPRYTIKKSTDGGFTWSKIDKQFYIRDIYFIDNRNGWATHEDQQWNRYLLKTTDGGYNWASTPMDEAVYEFFGTGNKIILKASNHKMYITTDAGTTWNVRAEPSLNPHYIFHTDNIIATGDHKSFFISYDQGFTWERHFNVFSSGGFSLATADGNTFLCGGWSGNLFKTTNTGLTWIPLTTCNFYFGGISYVDENNVYASGQHLMRTSNGGITWEIIFNDFYSLYPIHFINSTTGFAFNNLFDTSYTSIFLQTTDRGDTWTPLHQDTQCHPKKIFFKDSNNGYAIGDNLYYRTTDGGISWDYSNLQGISGNDINFYNSLSGYIVGSGIGYYTTNGGTVWISKSNYRGHSLFFIDSLIGWKGELWAIQKTTNGGNSFFDIENYGQNDELTNIRFFDRDTGYMQSDDSGISSILFVTEGGYNRWPILTYPYIWKAVSEFIAPNRVWLADNMGSIYKYTDENVPVELLTFNAKPEGKSIKLDWSTSTEINNKGFQLMRKMLNEEWNEIAFIKGAGTSTVQSNYNYTDKISIAGRYFYQLIQVDLNGTIHRQKEIEVNFTELPEVFMLYQNYPNPFNSSTKIKFSVGLNPAPVVIKIYDILGKEIVALLNEPKAQGIYEVEFNSQTLNLPSGVYICKASQGNVILTNKIILLK